MNLIEKYLVEAKSKIPFKATRAFREGLRHGAEDFLLSRTDVKKSFLKTSFYKKFDETAYKIGYEIASNEKTSRMKDSELLRYAFNSKKFEPIGWEIYQDSMGHVTIEEI